MSPHTLKKAAIVQVRASCMKYAQGIITPTSGAANSP